MFPKEISSVDFCFVLLLTHSIDEKAIFGPFL